MRSSKKRALDLAQTELLDRRCSHYPWDCTIMKTASPWIDSGTFYMRTAQRKNRHHQCLGATYSSNTDMQATVLRDKYSSNTDMEATANYERLKAVAICYWRLRVAMFGCNRLPAASNGVKGLRTIIGCAPDSATSLRSDYIRLHTYTSGCKRLPAVTNCYKP